MQIHLVYEEDYVEQLRGILENAGHSVTELDFSLSQFTDFSERKGSHSDIALVDGQAGVATKKEIIECLGRVRKNLPFLRLIVVFQSSLQKDEAFISKLLTFSIYDMYFRDDYSIDDLEMWINNPKNFGSYDVETEDIRGVLTESEKPKLKGVDELLKPSQETKAKAIPLPKLPQFGLPNIEVKLPSLSSVISRIPAIHLPKKAADSCELSWDENGEQGNSAGSPKELLGRVIWFWGIEPGLSVTYAANQLARSLAETEPVLLIDGNFINPSLHQEYDCTGPGWECSWLERIPGKPPKKFYAKGNLSVWTLQEPVEVDETAEMWNVALFHIRTPKQIVVVDGGMFSPPEYADLNVLIGKPAGEPTPKMVIMPQNEYDLVGILADKIRTL